MAQMEQSILLLSLSYPANAGRDFWYLKLMSSRPQQVRAKGRASGCRVYALGGFRV